MSRRRGLGVEASRPRLGWAAIARSGTGVRIHLGRDGVERCHHAGGRHAGSVLGSRIKCRHWGRGTGPARWCGGLFCGLVCGQHRGFRITWLSWGEAESAAHSTRIAREPVPLSTQGDFRLVRTISTLYLARRRLECSTDQLMHRCDVISPPLTPTWARLRRVPILSIPSAFCRTRSPSLPRPAQLASSPRR